MNSTVISLLNNSTLVTTDQPGFSGSTKGTCSYPTNFAEVDYISTYIYLLAIPTICVLGAGAAVMCIVVFTRKQMRSSLNVYLAGLSVFDLILLSFSALIFSPLQGCVLQGHGDTAVCHFFWRSTPWTLPISNIAQCGSVWTCVAVTVDRFLAVNYPLHSKIWCTPRRATTILIAITVFSILFKAPMFFELTNDDCGRLRTSFLRDNKYYKEYYVTFGYLIALLLIPWTVMIILNVFVVKAVHKAYKIRRSMQGGKNNQEEKDRRCTLMAIAMVLTFLIFNVVAAVNNLAETVFEVSLGFWSPIGNLLICLNSASNIVIYSLFGARFRQMCVLMLCGRQSRWMEWLKVGRYPPQSMVSDWDGRDGTTRKTSLDASTALLSARRMTISNFITYPVSSRRWSKRSQSGAPHQAAPARKDTVIYTSAQNRLSLQSAPS
ncbi:G-protein coupled receptors family 1 profile domain-containing protein [Caenorhabditis elegans]|uniref:G-protein coupled receptors family 1 profile domain-containing protein n=1 Tax=Caenorhabditis elegans TaxID=6239 RepID=Q20686_CAEEL|nr:G-protein coupled receptors family 1 profile domain-containing protein [Caenorhabditis elegans]CCD68810.1 G-protein coupled receptors family 1 profile domain-containing protein [Caenorhabditis elegans]|eukprot:NP_509470.3 FMRFamide Peptide Receptor family [Caenorhabditis elegans]